VENDYIFLFVATVSTVPVGAGTRSLPSLRADARFAAWWIAVGAVAGSLAGALVGGIGGRLAMLVLRLATPDLPAGLISDDGFEIGVFDLGASLQLYAGMAVFGAVNGLFYAALRGLVPRGSRLALWGLFSAAVGGSQFVHTDGVDFTLLDPKWFAIASFVVLPGLAAALVVVLVERAARFEPWRCPRKLALFALPGVPGLLVLPAAVIVGAGIVVLARVGVLRRAIPRVGRIVVPLLLLAGTIAGAVSIVRDAVEIL